VVSPAGPPVVWGEQNFFLGENNGGLSHRGGNISEGENEHKRIAPTTQIKINMNRQDL